MGEYINPIDSYNKRIEAISEMLKYYHVTNQEVLENTPRRFLKFMDEYTSALKNDYTDFKAFPKDSNQMVVMECSFYSLCEHHLLPYFGKVFIGYLPKTEVLGVSKLIKLTQHLFKKPSIQERVTEEIATTLMKNLDTAGVAVIVKGLHLCVAMRYREGLITTASMHGNFKHNPFAKEEFLSYVTPRLNEFKF